MLKAKGLSICIPNWNHRNFLPRSIGSARRAAVCLRARGVECEVLIVDDFSRDGSGRMLLSAVLQEDAAEVRVVFHRENLGLASARNTALHECKYDIICFMDADNEMIDQNASIFYDSIVSTNAAIAYGNLIKIVSNEACGMLSNEIINDSIYLTNFIDAFSFINVSRIVELGGYYGKHAAAHEDWELLLHAIAENERIVFVPAVLGYYHISDLSMIQTTQFDASKMRRVYSQRGANLPAGFERRLIYHPYVGYL